MVVKKVQAVIYDIENGEPYFLVFHRILNWRGWELHKGTLEDSETPEKALRREIREETGLTKLKIVKSLGVSFYFNRKRCKVVDVFLVRASMNNKVDLSKNPCKEHDGYLWVNRNAAIRKLTWSNAKKIVKNINIKS